MYVCHFCTPLKQPDLYEASSVRIPLPLRASPIYRVVNPAINRRFTRIVRHDHGSRRVPHIAMRVSDLEGDGIDTSVASTFALRPELNRLAVRGDDDVV